ncbi:hypothetical protein [Bradyrhizobium sp. 150]|uniref:hypothetical protein n=1 Tax=Bradyrhizobium sp. 150 TaxID=2782625 RepID=UPI001FF9A2C8|nr:hypothetical protein [Bradyrhizobium sp. 150]MCK1670335.1 hypothetical protein [Bradyrhizobium sp. 150]
MPDECSMEVSDSDHTITTNDHAHEFICTDCGDQVHKFGDHDGLDVCATCRYIREHPDMPEHIKRLLRGDDQ